MAQMSTFDPFHNRLCRDIRNSLSIHFMRSIDEGNLSPVANRVQSYKSKGGESFVHDYMDNRLVRYQAVISEMVSKNIPLNDIYRIACLIWNQALFFEFHEWLERFWQDTAGPEKEMIQALIRSAGVFLLLESGRTKGARKMAVKAVEGLHKQQSCLPGFLDVALLTDKLSVLDPVPPKFIC